MTTLTLNNTRLRASVRALTAAILALAATSCGQAQPASHDPALKLDGFAQYVSRFEQLSSEYGRPVQVTDLAIRFGQVDQAGETGGRGVCEVSAGSTPVITISRAAWDSSSEDEREELIFHELGHCVLGKVHEGGLDLNWGIPKSLMNPYKIDGSVYQQFRAYYLSKLFSE